MKNQRNRRTFLRNTVMATAGASLLSSSSFANAFTGENCPYPGYNPYVDIKTDLRSSSWIGEHITVKGTIYDRQHLGTVCNAKVEVWHLSPNSKKYRHRGQMETDVFGNYEFITDFPNREYGKSRKIYFKITSGDRHYFTELILDQNGASINSAHWQDNQHLEHKLFPTQESFLDHKSFNFNITV